MRCEQAQELFDGYLDGDLSPTLTRELGAHQLSCPKCRQAIALIEVTGHILASNTEDEELDEGFTNRLLSCLERSRAGWPARFRLWFYVGGPLAAAAVVAFGFLGVFSRSDSQVAGRRAFAPTPLFVAENPDAGGRSDETIVDSGETPLDRWIRDGMESAAGKDPDVDEQPRPIELTILQLFDVINEAMESEAVPEGSPGAEQDPAVLPSGAPLSTNDDIEDL